MKKSTKRTLIILVAGLLSACAPPMDKSPEPSLWIPLTSLGHHTLNGSSVSGTGQLLSAQLLPQSEMPFLLNLKGSLPSNNSKIHFLLFAPSLDLDTPFSIEISKESQSQLQLKIVPHRSLPSLSQSFALATNENGIFTFSLQFYHSRFSTSLTVWNHFQKTQNGLQLFKKRNPSTLLVPTLIVPRKYLSTFPYWGMELYDADIHSSLSIGGPTE